MGEISAGNIDKGVICMEREVELIGTDLDFLRQSGEAEKWD